MYKEVQVRLPQTAYDIWIGENLLQKAGERVAAVAAGAGAVVVSDENVWGLYGEALCRALDEQGIQYGTVVVPPGEGSKSLACLEMVYSAFADASLTRGGLVVAFGGGVVGDLAGFAAATWMRGVACAQIPTSLLAQVDSSVGGKTGIDLPFGKNLVGAFHQPRFVLADTGVLKTLPPREYAGGMAEVVKYGTICDGVFFEALAGETPPEVDAIVERCCAIKRDIVQRDEKESGERKLLNFGHTFGHAVEALGGYSRYGHGQAVAIGMVLAAKLGETLGVTPAGTAGAITAALNRWDLPTDCPFSAKDMMAHVLLDKKRQADGIDLVLLEDIGRAVVRLVAIDDIEKRLEEVCA